MLDGSQATSFQMLLSISEVLSALLLFIILHALLGHSNCFVCSSYGTFHSLHFYFGFTILEKALLPTTALLQRRFMVLGKLKDGVGFCSTFGTKSGMLVGLYFTVHCTHSGPEGYWFYAELQFFITLISNGSVSIMSSEFPLLSFILLWYCSQSQLVHLFGLFMAYLLPVLVATKSSLLI